MECRFRDWISISFISHRNQGPRPNPCPMSTDSSLHMRDVSSSIDSGVRPTDVTRLCLQIGKISYLVTQKPEQSTGINFFICSRWPLDEVQERIWSYSSTSSTDTFTSNIASTEGEPVSPFLRRGVGEEMSMDTFSFSVCSSSPVVRDLKRKNKKSDIIEVCKTFSGLLRGGVWRLLINDLGDKGFSRAECQVDVGVFVLAFRSFTEVTRGVTLDVRGRFSRYNSS